MGRVDGKVAFITGAGRGMGRSHALRLAAEGADLILCDICRPIEEIPYPMSSEQDLQDTAEQARGLGARVVFRPADVRSRDSLASLLETGVAELGKLDVIVANAGVLAAPGTWDSVTDERMRITLDVNLIGVWNTCALGIPYLLESGGSIICISSAAGIKGQPLTLPYTASKWGVTGLAISLANELAEYSIRVNSVHPTAVATGIRAPELHDLVSGPKASLASLYQNAFPVERIDAVEISHAVLYLASDESRYVTGLQLKVDAGMTIR